MTLVERVGEGLARHLDRRKTLKGAVVAVFGAVAAWTVEGIRGNGALAQQCGYVTEGDCTCTPPGGLYCHQMDPALCSGSACAGGCSFDETYRYAGACWCSATCQYGGGAFGYYQCCDCNCYGQLCACGEFIPLGSSDVSGPVGPSDAVAPPLPPPGFGDDEPTLPPGVPSCFPFCD